MKFLSVLALIVLLGWTWKSSHSFNAIPTQVHFQVQQDFHDFVKTYIHEHVPTAKNIQFQKLWTEPEKGNNIKATFTYSFETEGNNASRTLLSGFALLIPDMESLKDQTPITKWVLDKIVINNEEVNYQNGSIITPGETILEE